ncbi:SLC4A3 [Cordylochernes scorpioides]|uniref:Anion exchange protein n=1 Tax=Cordylochernes scorpioides TaxID=51811 RepID=A0ABY6KC53_9ARAC|nr:SLC4A3 [Cordylochernes scorpioides]UYV66431.1 SLC4A3 [Cordylochernes scorpioides]
MLQDEALLEEDHKKHLSGISRRIPIDSECTVCLAGALEDLSKPIVGFIRLAQGQNIPRVIEVAMPVRFLFVLLTPLDSNLDFHEMGRAISTLMCDQEFVEVVYQAETMRELLLGINNFLDDSIVLPPSTWENKSLLDVNGIRKKSLELRRRKERKSSPPDEEKKVPPPPRDPLKRTQKIFGGLVEDVKSRFSWYLSDFTDGLNPQCFASAIFIYFAAISAAITFGGLMGDKTDAEIGVSEALVVTCVSGVLFSLLSGQPLVVVGMTGPTLLFDEILYQFCVDNQLEFLSLRFWISLWVAAIATVVVAWEGSALVRFFTRFTQEIFASLISLLYIYESFLKLYAIFFAHPLVLDYCSAVPMNTTNTTVASTVTSQPNTALWSAIMMMATFLIALSLRRFRNSRFLVRSVRRALGDFGVPIAIIFIVAIDYSIIRVYTQKLTVPEGLSPSKPDYRGWIISPLGLQTSISALQIFCSSFAALLIFILLFLEIQISELIVNKKERKLRKGSGFHLDLLLISYLQVVAALLGGPWVCAATVRSVSHVASLTVMSRTHAPGEKPKILGVKEQRLSNLLVSLLIGVSVFMAPVLSQVPVAALFGIFLYMGVSSMSGIQFFERLTFLFMPAKHHPDFSYVRKVRSLKMHLYTAIQVVCLAVLWVVKSTRAALGFPFVLLLMVPVRYYCLPCCFSPAEIRALDGEESDSEDEPEDDDPDFYKQILP